MTTYNVHVMPTDGGQNEYGRDWTISAHSIEAAAKTAKTRALHLGVTNAVISVSDTRLSPVLTRVLNDPNFGRPLETEGGTMIARFPGKCAACHGAISPGDAIAHLGRGRTLHAACHGTSTRTARPVRQRIHRLSVDVCKFCGDVVNLDAEGKTYRDGTAAHDECADSAEFQSANAQDFAD